MGTKAQSLAYIKRLCKYYTVVTPKYRRKIIFPQLRDSTKESIQSLCKHKGIEILEGHLLARPCWWISRQRSGSRVLWGSWKAKVHWWSLLSMQTLNINLATENWELNDIMSAPSGSTGQRSESIFSIRRSTTSCKTSWRHGNIRTPLRCKSRQQQQWVLNTVKASVFRRNQRHPLCGWCWLIIC